VTATFTAATVSYTLTVTPAGTGTGTVTSTPAGINCGSTCAATFNSGTSVTLTATPSSGSTFAGWSGACTGTATCTVTVSANTSVTATFNVAVVTYTLTVMPAGNGSGTVTSTPTGINCGTTCTASFNSGTMVTLTATPGANSTFTGWSGACSGTGACSVVMNADTSVTATYTATAFTLTVTPSGTGSGTVSSTPSGIDCGSACTATFSPGTQVTLTTTTNSNSYLVNWTGACSGDEECVVTLNSNLTVGATINLWPINHIIFLAQENRSFDHYFGALRQYWADNGYPDQSFNGLPQFNPTSGTPPLYGPPPSIAGCDPSKPYQQPPAPFQDCIYDANSTVTSYHLITQCIENPSPTWDEGHVDWDYFDQTGVNPAALNGFVWTAGHDSRYQSYYGHNPFNDTDGIRAMGYYTGDDLNYYYFMASNFGTSDSWYNPVMTRTNANRDALISGTSQGYVYPIGTNSNDQNLLTATTIFQELQDAGINWKIYINPTGTPCTGPPYDATCLLTTGYLQNFEWGQTVGTQYPQNIGTIGIGNSDWDNDLANGTLPAVAQIEPASAAALDEHPTVNDTYPSNSQAGAAYVAGLINGLMGSSSWSDSAFILTFDESGGFYEHVSPQPAVSPDGIAPSDLYSTDICFGTPGIGTCDFTYTGYRVPLIVVSPYAKQNYVSHTVADYTAILKFIETRFSLSNLNARDDAQMDMSEFFDFNDPPWMTPPSPPAQITNSPCYLTSLP
jgi:phospholipase C